jgi:tRNA A37 threonylcarbamoyladenosine synthetase subunit TsaC/SUA5/YrdC
VIGFENGRPVLLREGAVTKAQIETVTGSALLGKLL